MNLCDYQVNRVHGIPFQKYGKWWLAVGYTYDNGSQRRTELMFDTFDEANSVREGHKFLA